MYHKLIQNKCGDDNVQSGNGQNIIRVDPCLKLFNGCPIMISTNEHKKIGAVKGTTAKFKGVQLKQGKTSQIELWNGFKVQTVNANDVQFILCEHYKKNLDDPPKTFKLPTALFSVTTKLPLRDKKSFLTMAKSRIEQFPINNDLATTGHKLQGMTKKFLIISSINYSTPNWVYVVLSRVTSLEGLFLMQPLKQNFNPKPTKLLQEEWRFQKHLEKETLLHLQHFGNFPNDIDICMSSELDSVVDTSTPKHIEMSVSQSLEQRKKKRKKNTFGLTSDTYDCSIHPIVHHFDAWLTRNKMKRLPHRTIQYGNCLYESVASCIPLWTGKPVELRFRTIEWARSQVSAGTNWGITMWLRFDDRNGNPDNYGKTSFLDYLALMEDPKIYGTEYDIFMLCEFLKISILVYSSSLLQDNNGEITVETPYRYGEAYQSTVLLWYFQEHYEPIDVLQ